MAPEEWALIGEIYQAALERNAAERASFLARACGGNDLLRSEVESLLAAEQEAGGFLCPDAADTASLAPPEPPLIAGKKLHHYELVSRLGTGGMGEVYRALDTKLRREIAIKILPSAFARDTDRLRRFEQEARAASALNHPNIVTIYETGQTEDGSFLAMELVQGETLRGIIGSRPSMEQVIRIGLQVAQALKVAHAAHIIHRDVKPENLMLRPDGYVKMLDFGLARSLPPMAGAGSAADGGPGGDAGSAITGRGMVVGTARYMSPEQAQVKHVTGATDVFSFGLVIYELATGQHPFRAETEFGTLNAMLSQAALPPSRINPALPPALERLILQMLEKKPEDRPSAAAVESALAEIAASGPAGTKEGLFRSGKRSVGRQREHEQLNALWDSAAASHGLLCCISGEPGIGKTTLVEDFLAGLAPNGRRCLVARGRCSERLAGTEAYSPLLEAFDALQNGAGSVADLMRRLAPTWYGQVASSTSSEAPGAGSRVERAYSQERIKREFGSFLQELSRRQTVVLFLEDLHWADISTIDLLAFLADRIERLSLLIVITFRPSDLRLVKHPFLKLKGDLQARGVAREIQLGFLSSDEVKQYIALEFSPHQFPPEVAAMVHAKTEGSPLFMTDLLRYFRDRQIIAQEGGRWILARPLPEIERDLPESTRAMIETTLGQLGADDHRLLVAASVQGHEFDSAVIARALGRDEAGVEERLQQLERIYQFAGLVEEREFPTKALTLRYRFTHVLYQNALYATLQPARRVALSNRVAEALLTLYGEQSAAVSSDLAHLFEVGRAFLRAAEHYLIAARNASRVFAASESAALARRGLLVIQAAPPNSERNETEFLLQLALGSALQVVLGYGAQETEEVYDRAHEFCRKAGDPVQLLPILYGLWASHLVKGDIESTLRFGEDFLNLAQRIQSPAVLVGERMVGCPLFYLGQLTQARPYLERALSIYDPAQHRSLAWQYGQEPGMTTRSYLAWTMWLLGYPDQAAGHNRECLRLAREVDHALSRGHGLFFSAVHAHLRQDWEALSELADELVLYCEKREVAFWLPAGRVLRGLVMTKNGNGEEGLTEMRAGIETLAAAHVELCMTILHRFLAEGYAQLHRPSDALVAIQAGLDLIQRSRERCFEPELHRFQGELLLQQGGCGAAIKAEESFRRAI
ncbi:MAG: protein kinase, partial [Acidobacteriota bacterium]|nr:protein kinase [Acidobacteriota bacterium]